MSYQLRKTIYFPDTGSSKSEYICSLGPDGIIGESALGNICRDHDLDIEKIRALERITVVSDDEYIPPKSGPKPKINESATVEK